MKQHYISLLVLTTLLVCTNSYGQITGKAWQDHNANGEIEIVESGQFRVLSFRLDGVQKWKRRTEQVSL